MNLSNIHILDLIILLGAIQGIIFSLFLWMQNAGNKKAIRFLGLFIFGFSINLFFNFLEPIGLRTGMSVWDFVPLQTSLLIIAAFHFFVAFTTTPNRKFSLKDGLLFLPFLFQFVFQFWVFIQYLTSKDFVFQKIQSLIRVYDWIDISGVILGLGMLVVALFRIQKHEENIRNNYSEVSEISLEWLKKLLFLLVVIWLAFAIPTIYEQFTNRPSIAIFYPLWVGTSALIYWIGYTAYARKELFQVQLFHQESKPEIKSLSNNTKVYYENLLRLMEDEKPYLNPDLNLKLLAEQLDISSGYLSQIINQYEEKNFFDFINSYRVNSVKEKIIDSQFNHLNLLGLAYESGFKSKSTFNLAFKKLAGMTPTAFKKSKKV